MTAFSRRAADGCCRSPSCAGAGAWTTTGRRSPPGAAGGSAWWTRCPCATSGSRWPRATPTPRPSRRRARFLADRPYVHTDRGPAHAGHRPQARPLMRVLVVPKWYPWPELPVFGLFCREHAAALATRHDVVVLATLFTPDPPDFRVFKLTDEVEDGLRVLRVRYRRPRLRPLALVCQLVGMVAAVRRLRREGWRPDVVHAHVYSAALPALAVGRRRGALVAVTEHYTGFGRGLITGTERRLARFAFERADVVAPVSQELAGQLREVAPKASFVVVPNTVDTDAFEPPAGAPRRHAAAERGRAGREEGPPLPAGGADRATRSARWMIAGDGELRAELERGSRAGAAGPGDVPGRAAQGGGGAADARGRPVRAAQPGREPAGGADRGHGQRPAGGGHARGRGARDARRRGRRACRRRATRPRWPRAIRARRRARLRPRRHGRPRRDRYCYDAVAGAGREIYDELPSRRGNTSSATRRRTASSGRAPAARCARGVAPRARGRPAPARPQRPAQRLGVALARHQPGRQLAGQRQRRVAPRRGRARPAACPRPAPPSAPCPSPRSARR